MVCVITFLFEIASQHLYFIKCNETFVVFLNAIKVFFLKMENGKNSKEKEIIYVSSDFIVFSWIGSAD